MEVVDWLSVIDYWYVALFVSWGEKQGLIYLLAKLFAVYS